MVAAEFGDDSCYGFAAATAPLAAPPARYNTEMAQRTNHHRLIAPSPSPQPDTILKAIQSLKAY